MGKRALITGVEGQDGYYLSRFLAERGYEVYGTVRKKARHEITAFDREAEPYRRIDADMTEFSGLYRCIDEVRPDEVYNLAGLSEIPASWRQPVLTAEVNATGVLRLLEAIHLCAPGARFLQSSTSEIFARSDRPLSEGSALATRNPYGTAKLYGQWITTNYRESYGMFACSAILFNHESPRRGVDFVTRKITASVARIHLGRQDVLTLGNLDAVRDWGSADDYVRAMWMILQEPEPDDFVIATGVAHTVRDFVTAAFGVLGTRLCWEGEGFDEVGVDARSGRVLVRVDPALFRYPREDRIVGDPAKARDKLGFRPARSFEGMVEWIVRNDLSILTRSKL